jgi:quinol-cytochrome oxidoreductase complex cytochrome b subunit
MGQEEEHQEPRRVEEAEEAVKSRMERLANFISSRTGATYPLFRPVPEFSLNPFYWLGALSVVAFIIQGVTGLIMALYYIPTTDSAYTTTQYIFKSVYFGQFLETIHLYTAYAMIMLAFMHMMRGYFVSVHKKPREIMWMVGMIMGFVTLGFGFTGYLLPYTVVSTSASEVGIGMLAVLPTPLANLANFLVVGTGGTASELLRFYDLHVIVLPAVLLALLAVKMWMLETHGVAEPVTGSLTERLKKTLPIFPDVTVYLLELAVIFGVGMLLISALFPIQLGPEYTQQAAAAIAAQPDWYFLWLYQILKIKIFETAGLPVALTFASAVFVVLTLLPFIDKGEDRRIIDRPKFVILGAIFVAELVVLAAWGLITPGQVIPNLTAVEVLGGTALIVTLAMAGVYAAVRPTSLIAGPRSSPSPSPAAGGPIHHLYEGKWMGLGMAALMGFGALGIGISVDSVVQMIEFGVTTPMLVRFSASACLMIAVVTSAFLGLRWVGSQVASHNNDLLSHEVQGKLELN